MIFMTLEASEVYESLRHLQQKQYIDPQSISLSALRLPEGTDETCIHGHQSIHEHDRRGWGVDCGTPRGKKRACILGQHFLSVRSID